jgi:Na+/melibiose symporter-like transporter
MGPTPRRILLSYSMGSIGTGLYLTVPSILLLYYLTQILGISPALAGLAVFLPRIWDVVTDPVMGWMSDRTRSRLGRRRPYLLIGAILTSLTFGFLFSAPVFPSQAMSFVYVLVIYVLSATAYTVYAVPYLSMPAEMSTDSSERSRIMSYRMTFAMVGVLPVRRWPRRFWNSMAAGAAVSLQCPGRSASSAQRRCCLAFFGTARRRTCLPSPRMSAAGASCPICARIRTSWRLRWPILPSSPASACFVAIGFAFFWLTALDGKKAVTLAATLIIGIGFGGLQLLPFAMLTDVIHAARLRGRDSAGVYTGAWTAVEKGGLALGPLIVGGVLSLGGYVSASETQGGDTVAAIRAAMTLIPAVFVLISIPIMFRCKPAHVSGEIGTEALSP